MRQFAADAYRVCNRLLDVETNEHCEFDGIVAVYADGFWRCPACDGRRWSWRAGLSDPSATVTT